MNLNNNTFGCVLLFLVLSPFPFLYWCSINHDVMGVFILLWAYFVSASVVFSFIYFLLIVRFDVNRTKSYISYWVILVSLLIIFFYVLKSVFFNFSHFCLLIFLYSISLSLSMPFILANKKNSKYLFIILPLALFAETEMVVDLSFQKNATEIEKRWRKHHKKINDNWYELSVKYKKSKILTTS